MNMMIGVSKSDIKRNCLFAFMHHLLYQGYMQDLRGVGEVIIDDDKNLDLLRKESVKILDHWTKVGWTTKNIYMLSQRLKFVRRYYDAAEKLVTKEFPVGAEYIPLYLALTIANRYEEHKLKVLPNDIDVKALIEIYDKSGLIDKKEKWRYHKISRRIVEGIKNVK